MIKHFIYADHAATTMLLPEALEAMLPFLRTEYGNASTLYSLARKPKKAIAAARAAIAKCIGAEPDEIFFTSCGTESDNWALKGTAFRFLGQKKRIITSSIEHHAVLHSCAFLERMGYDVVYLPVDEKGLVSPADLEKAINEATVLVSIMMANNEIGTIEPIAELAEVAHKYGVLFHTDAVQAVGHLPINVNHLCVDMLSASAHKFNGPKGMGFLYVRKGTPLLNLLDGGAQENGHRGGTENVAGIVGMSEALKFNVENMQKHTEHLLNLQHLFIKELDRSGFDYVLNGSEERIPGSFSISFPNREGEAILHRLDLMGVAVTTGSACNSKETVISHVLKAIDLPDTLAKGTVRFTFGFENTEEEVKYVANYIAKILK
ncbi:cysteine desulfurase family protein [uncultured Phascolarctobacterium sp.]|uniref:cysteine desulfurase family protein n=1 Tax=uncultured Phascolarctobacterium sp. TaxID=512296 RepID=UPI00262DC075|nr:cysteine desulfurase family protein [uncultured Phascolarctobacterium sp.]